MSLTSDEIVVLVDVHDHPTGTAEKGTAHRQGWLHRAVSVLIFNPNGEWLLQKRNAHKYHSGGLWTNACCTHPRPEESPLKAATRRLEEEMGIRCRLLPWFTFLYRAELDQGMVEHELDHVFYGICETAPVLNPQEADDWKWISSDLLKQSLSENPEQFTIWFRLIMDHIGCSLPPVVQHHSVLAGGGSSR